MRPRSWANMAETPIRDRLAGYWHTATAIDQLVRLRNWYVAYVLVIFLVGGYLYRIDLHFLALDGVLYISSFLVGYWLQDRRSSPVSGPGRRVSRRAVTWLVAAILLARLAVIGYQALVVYGFRNYISGAALVGQISDYGRYSVENGLYVILNSALNFGTVACCALYVRECLVQQRRPRFDLVAAAMIGAPILELQRSYILFGVVFVGVAYIYTARLRGENVTRRFVAAAVAAILAVSAGVYLGLLRENALSHGALNGQSVGVRVVGLLHSEVSPVTVYATIRRDTGRVFDFQLGQTIFGPLAFKLVPRSWDTHKPINSAAFYATRYDSVNFAAGFVVSPTFWTALYLNYGYPGSLLGSFVLGILTGRVDRIFVQKRTREFGWLLIVYYNYYLLLRQDIADMLAVFILTGAVFIALGRLLPERPEGAAAVAVPSH